MNPRIQHAKLTLKLVRTFSIGFKIYSIKLNGLRLDIELACFILHFNYRGKKLLAFENYWLCY